MKYKKNLIIFLVLITVFTLGYLVVFGRALTQEENHFGIVLALPKVILSSNAVQVDDKTYLTKNNNFFIKEMEKQGFSYKEHMGAGYVFEKNGETFMSVRKMYSSYFMVFTYPTRIIK